MEGGSCSSGGGMMMMMGLYGENSNSGSSSSASGNINNINGVFCPMMFMSSTTTTTTTTPTPTPTTAHTITHTTNNISPASDYHHLLQPLTTTTTTATADTSVHHRCVTPARGVYFMDTDVVCGAASVRAKIMAHPHYPRLLAAYANCQKVGAPPEVVAKLEEACSSAAAAVGSAGLGCIGEDPALDQFMEAYCEMLTKYEQELSKPFKEAMLFLQRIESQFKTLTLASTDSVFSDGMDRNNGSSEEEVDVNNSFIDPQAEDRELKTQLLQKYSGYLGSLKQEFMKKRKKGKLPKEARQQLLDWWSRHYKWPYPSESQKLALAESTGLDQKQINNWFINQRKRHWKPSEDMQFVVMDAAHPHYYMDNVLGNPFPMDISPSLL